MDNNSSLDLRTCKVNSLTLINEEAEEPIGQVYLDSLSFYIPVVTFGTAEYTYINFSNNNPSYPGFKFYLGVDTFASLIAQVTPANVVNDVIFPILHVTSVTSTSITIRSNYDGETGCYVTISSYLSGPAPI